MAITIRTRIIISFAFIFTLFMIIGSMIYYNRTLLYSTVTSLEDTVMEMKVLADLQLDTTKAVMPPNDYLITGDIREKERFEKVFLEIDKHIEQFKRLKTFNKHIAFYNGLSEKLITLRKKAEDIFAIRNPVGNKSGARLMQELDAFANDIATAYFNTYHETEKAELEKNLAFAETAKQRVNRILFISVAAAVVVTALFALYLIRSILIPISEFKEGAHIIGNGNLDYRINLNNGSEMNVMADEFNKMAQRLKESYADLEEKIEERTSELKELNIKLRELSVTDGLTTLYNHRYFYQRLEDEMARARRYKHHFSVIMADIDHFKLYNDTHGHLEGDKIVRGVASCLKKNIRGQDVIARYGGEEFSFILPETDTKGARVIAERMRQSVLGYKFPHEETQPGGSVSISMGIATFPQHANNPIELLRKADDALYKAKANGRNRVEACGSIQQAKPETKK